MGLLLDLLAAEFPDIARERDRVRREAALTAAVKDATTVVDTARALVTVHDDGSRSVHPSAALTVPALLDEIDRLTAALPVRGDAVATWLKAHRDAADDWTPTKATIGHLLDEYRLHADTGTPLNQHACEGNCADCASGGTR
ncbi:hypothetical protein ACWFMI_24820 [Nocardiopsis terrae]|uniref:hypothetical protein n=1 Tax=Streptomyces sp. NPDC057554 TaxID=3350538 RepID=UPI0036AC02F5